MEDFSLVIDKPDRLYIAPEPKTTLVWLLLQYDANVHIRGGRFGSAWHAAAAARTRYDDWKVLIEMLLSKGVDINDAGGRPEDAATALHAVLQSRDPFDALEKLDFLLSRGGKLN